MNEKEQEMRELREHLRAAIEEVQRPFWRYKFPEAESHLLDMLGEVDRIEGQSKAPVLVDLRARSLDPLNPGHALEMRLKAIRGLMKVIWPKPWRPLFCYLEQAEKVALIAYCD